MTDNGRALNNAIVKKVESILNNTDFIDDISIYISGSRETAVTIRYNVKERIVADSGIRSDNEDVQF